MWALAIFLMVLSGLILFYVIAGRPWLKRQSWTGKFFDLIEPFEILLWQKSETILWARFKQFIGILLTVLTQIGAIDLSPVMPFLPSGFQWIPALLPLIITLVGLLDEYLRRGTTKPVEFVALPDDESKLPPGTAEALAIADTAKQDAVMLVESDKRAGLI